MSQNEENQVSEVPELRFKNQNQLIYYIYRQVVDGRTGENVSGDLLHLNNRDEVYKFFTADPRTGRNLTVNEKRENVKGLCSQIAKDRERSVDAGSLEESMFNLNMQVAGLVGDVAAALIQLDLKNPKNIRDVYKTYEMIMDPKLSNDTIIKEAISVIYEKTDDQNEFEGFMARHAELFPNPLADDDDDEED